MLKRITLGSSKVILLGTSHVAEQSARQVKELFKTEKPDIVALELDRDRFNTMLLRARKTKYKKSYYNIRSIGLQGFLFAKIASFLQQKIASKLGVESGVEMETAIKLAEKNKTHIVLIDRNIKKTLQDFSSKIPMYEKLKLLFVDPIVGLFTPKERVVINLRKVPEDKLIRKVMKIMRQRYPYMYKVLVADRNKILSKNIFTVSQGYPGSKILCVLGAGHIEGVYNLLKKYETNQANEIEVSYSFTL